MGYCRSNYSLIVLIYWPKFVVQQKNSDLILIHAHLFSKIYLHFLISLVYQTVKTLHSFCFYLSYEP